MPQTRSTSPFLQIPEDEDPLSDAEHAELDSTSYLALGGPTANIAPHYVISEIVERNPRFFQESFANKQEALALINRHPGLFDFVHDVWKSGSLKKVRNMGQFSYGVKYQSLF